MEPAEEKYHSRVQRGDVRGALRAARAGTGRRSRLLTRKAEARFVGGKLGTVPRADLLVRDLVLTFRAYYREGLLDGNSPLAEERLRRSLLEVARTHGLSFPAAVTWDTLCELLKRELRRRGYFSLWGRVAPFRSLLVWRKEPERTFQVPLTDGFRTVRVVLLDHFVELGWLHFASFGKAYVGGWAGKRALFCVARAYQRRYSSELFRISYLTHEARHFADYAIFPGMLAADLEYRAKLAELAASARPSLLLRKFRAEAKNDPRFPQLRDFGNPSSIGKNVNIRASELIQFDTQRRKTNRKSRPARQ